LRKISPFS